MENLPFVVLAVLLVLYLLIGIRVIQEYQRGVLFRLGRLAGLRGPGLTWVAPIFETAQILDLRVVTQSVAQQETITKDSVTTKVDAVLWYHISDPKLALVAVADFRSAVYQVALTTLRNIIGQHNLDEVLRDRDRINQTLQRIVDQTTTPWGIKIDMVEMKDVEIPEAMQRAMAREAEAQREKKARIIKAEAELEAAVKLTESAGLMSAHPAALELRRMQMISEVGAEHNTTTIIMMPSEFVSMAKTLSEKLGK
jgi:regulator of protease activity HflC (stomatin/prohibitin superfamily)